MWNVDHNFDLNCIIWNTSIICEYCTINELTNKVNLVWLILIEIKLVSLFLDREVRIVTLSNVFMRSSLVTYLSQIFIRMDYELNTLYQ